MYHLFKRKCTNKNCNEINTLYTEVTGEVEDVNYEYLCPSCKKHITFSAVNIFVKTKVVSNIPNDAIIAKRVQNID